MTIGSRFGTWHDLRGFGVKRASGLQRQSRIDDCFDELNPPFPGFLSVRGARQFDRIRSDRHKISSSLWSLLLPDFLSVSVRGPFPTAVARVRRFYISDVLVHSIEGIDPSHLDVIVIYHI